MKCPKCRYLGFETGDRCRNCGYDFSLLAGTAAEPPRDESAGAVPDLPLRDDATFEDTPAPLDLSLRGPEPEPAVPPAPVPALPLFRSDEEPEDEPLVRVAPPRPPIAVRKTPEAQRPRFPRPLGASRRPQETSLEFGGDPGSGERPAPGAPVPRSREAAAVSPVDGGHAAASPLGPRLAAALIDFGLLFGIDVVVIHFTLRLTSLTLVDWRLVPAAPLLVFLIGLKLAYLSAFTLAGGQTIGKMALGLRVVGDGDPRVDLSQAVRRAAVEVASLVAAGVPFLLALADPARRGLHDRVAHTRVVALS